MINKNELRLGNWVNFSDDNTKFMVIEISHSGLQVKNDTEETWIEIDQFSPIPISPEILEKCGFDCTTKGFYTHPNWYNLSIKFRKGTYELRCNFMDVVATNIDTLHHLQNLFFDTTSLELPFTNQ